MLLQLCKIVVGAQEEEGAMVGEARDTYLQPLARKLLMQPGNAGQKSKRQAKTSYSSIRYSTQIREEAASFENPVAPPLRKV